MPLNRTMLDCFREPWAILPGALTDPRWRAKAKLSAELVAQGMDTHSGATRVGSVSIVPIYGVIEYRSDWLLEYFGGTSVETIREALMAELADPNVKAIVLDIDSPGGTVAGITEFAAEIRAARGGTKPIVAVANTYTASAACWLAAQADEFVVTPSGHVGSIGVYALHQEMSGMLEQMGISTTIISAGPYKTEGNEFEPLTDAAKAEIQAQVDVSYDQFRADVAAGRRVPVATVEPQYGGGRLLDAKDALAAGLVDRIEPMTQTVQRLGRAIDGSGRRLRAGALPVDLLANADVVHGSETPDEIEVEAPELIDAAPFTERLLAFAAEATQLVEHASERARLRAKEGRPAFSTSTERSLRTIREAVDDLLEPDDPVPSEEPAAPVEPVQAEPSTPPLSVAIPPRFRSREDWLHHLEATTHR